MLLLGSRRAHLKHSIWNQAPTVGAVLGGGQTGTVSAADLVRTTIATGRSANRVRTAPSTVTVWSTLAFTVVAYFISFASTTGAVADRIVAALKAGTILLAITLTFAVATYIHAGGAVSAVTVVTDTDGLVVCGYHARTMTTAGDACAG